MVKWAVLAQRLQQGIVQPLLGLFLESTCPLCQRSTPGALCLDCERQLQACRLPNPSDRWQGDLPVFGWGGYGGQLKRAIAVFKYDSHPELARPLGHWLAQAWQEHASRRLSRGRATNSDEMRSRSVFDRESRLLVVPIPLHASKLKKRGFNQAELLARSFCIHTGLTCCPQGLQRVRATEAQFGLSPTARSQNVAAAFALGPDLRGKVGSSVLLLDDIYTTGATAQAAALTLRQAGMTVVGIVALALPQGAGNRVID
ncbi:ComF family protein [Trichothermofontia sp.]